MADRVHALAGEDSEDAWISTFHSCCARILRRDIEKLGYKRQFAIYDEDDRLTVIKAVAKALNLSDKEYLPDWMSARQLMDFFGDFYADFDRARAQEMLTRLGIDETMRIKQLSKGTREKVQLILVMSRQAKLYLLDEPIGGVDPATRDYILDTIIRNYNPSAAVVISTHLIADVEQVLDEVIFIQDGRVTLQASVDEIREEKGKSVDAYFREVFKC